MIDFNATRTPGQIVKLDGAYFGSLARVTAFHEAIPNVIDFEITVSADPSVKVGETGRSHADVPVVSES